MAISALLIAAIATVDWRTKPYVSLGFLYLFPIMLASGFLSRLQIAGLSVFCAILLEVFSSLPAADDVTRTVMVTIAFAGTGLFVSELVRNRQLTFEHLRQVREQVQLRRDAEEEVQILIESSPAAIVILDAEGVILLANHAAQALLSGDGESLKGQRINAYLPALHSVAQRSGSQVFRTSLQCKGLRRNGAAFLAAVWFSTYATLSGRKVAAIVVDLSEELRDREDLSLDHLLKNSRILIGAVAHEIRNLCGAASAVRKNLSRVPGLSDHQDFKALGTLIEGLERIACMELQTSAETAAVAVDLSSVLDELRILIEPDLKECGMRVIWNIRDTLPLVWADRYGLLQVFINIARNSKRAMELVEDKQLTVTASMEGASVLIRFEDTGMGVSTPNNLFRPFQKGADASGLGLYVSRALVGAFRGDLRYEPRPIGSCFTVELTPMPHCETT